MSNLNLIVQQEHSAKQSDAALLAELRQQHRKLLADIQAALRFERRVFDGSHTALCPNGQDIVRAEIDRLRQELSGIECQITEKTKNDQTRIYK
jgi:hypothetical protein